MKIRAVLLADSGEYRIFAYFKCITGYEYESITGTYGLVGVVALVVPDLFGCSVMGAGFVLFVNPYNFVPGGVYGMGIVLHNIFRRSRWVRSAICSTCR